jgi:transcriptional regulator with XRE-family HTH domain
MNTKGNNLRQILAKNVRMARAELRISQEELANRCGIHRNYIGAIERGECNVTLDTIWKLSQGLKKDLLTLLTN